jgi:cytoskeletal protein CcmA (bactofilin family)
MMISRSESGSALAIVVALSAIASLVISITIAMSVYRSNKSLTETHKVKARYAAESAISRRIFELLNDPSSLKIPDTINVNNDTVSRGDKNSYSVSSVTEPYLTITGTGKHESEQYHVQAQFGKELPKELQYALVLFSSSSPLEIGSGKINGDIRTAGSVNGSFNGKIIDPTNTEHVILKAEIPVKIRNSNLTRLDMHSNDYKIYHANSAFKGQELLELEEQNSIRVNGSLLLNNQINNKLITLQKPLSIIIKGDVQISGNIVINDIEVICGGEFKLLGNARIVNGCVYVKKKSFFSDESQYRGSLYSESSVNIAGQAQILMPSFFLLTGDSAKEDRSYTALEMSGESRFAGTVISTRSGTHSEIGKASLFMGYLQTQGKLVLKGNVYGTVLVNQMVDNLDSDENRMAEGSINRELLPRSFVLPVFLGVGDNFRLIRWTEYD